MTRRRTFGLLLLTIALGLASRRWPESQPAFVAAYAGDTLWAAAVFWVLRLLAPLAATPRLAMMAVAIAFADELSQLYHAPWIDAVRATTPGALLLGQGFLWSDLVCYVAGVGLAAVVDRLAVSGEARSRRGA
ncbi:MAG: DUF2809 domain-containing protein [Vicinamibacterales bacterium]